VYFPIYKESHSKPGPGKYPLRTAFCEPVRFKVRAIGKENKSKQRFTPNTQLTGLFGMCTVTDADKVIVITEGEFDAMAVH
jgi:DNA primase